MYIRTQQVDRQIHCVSDDKDQDKENDPDHIVRQHTAHLVDDRCDNARCKAQSQQTGIGKHVA